MTSTILFDAPKLTSLYRLPWSARNNPNGWIELTTHCPLDCPNCYRRPDENERPSVQRPLEEIKAEIDELIRLRNIQTVSLAGGEPLIYREINAVIRHARDRGLSVLLVTSGVGLNRKRLMELRDSGITRIVIHVQKYQNRVQPGTEEAVNNLRAEYCRLFREVNDVTLGFMFAVSPDNISDLPVVVRFYQENADVVRVAGFTVLGDGAPGHDVEAGRLSSARMLFERLRELYGLEYAAYLPHTQSAGPSWLFAYGVACDGQFVSWLDADVCREVQEWHLSHTGRYVYVANRPAWSWRWLWLMIRNRSLRRLWRHAWPLFVQKKIRSQMVFAIDTPTLHNGIWNVCEGCPDAIMWNGKMVPSCLLDRFKAGEPIPVFLSVERGLDDSRQQRVQT